MDSPSEYLNCGQLTCDHLQVSLSLLSLPCVFLGWHVEENVVQVKGFHATNAVARRELLSAAGLSRIVDKHAHARAHTHTHTHSLTHTHNASASTPVIRPSPVEENDWRQ